MPNSNLFLLGKRRLQASNNLSLPSNCDVSSNKNSSLPSRNCLLPSKTLLLLNSNCLLRRKSTRAVPSIIAKAMDEVNSCLAAGGILSAAGKRRENEMMRQVLLQQMHPLAVGADPRGAVAHAPCVFGKTGRADGEAAEAAAAVRRTVFAAMTETAAAPSSFSLRLFSSHARADGRPKDGRGCDCAGIRCRCGRPGPRSGCRPRRRFPQENPSRER